MNKYKGELIEHILKLYDDILNYPLENDLLLEIINKIDNCDLHLIIDNYNKVLISINNLLTIIINYV